MKEKRPKVISMKGFLTFQILHELYQRKLCGDDLASIIGEKKGSKLTPGTIYPALKVLRKNKLVKHRKFGRKKIYTITEEGVEEYKIVHENFTRIFKPVIKRFKK